MFKHLVGLAAKWGWMTRELADSVRSVQKLDEPPGRVRYLTDQETKQILGALRTDVRAVVVTALLTGMRLGELASLKKHEIDFGSGMITLVRTKTNRVRRIPIHIALVAILEASIARSACEHVFTNTKGRPLGRNATVIFRETIRSLGLRDLRFHDLRHDFATRLRMQGAGLDVIAKLLDHTTLAMTQRYAHLEMDLLQSAVDQLSSPEHEPRPNLELPDLATD